MSWADAYPLDIFPEPDWKRARDALALVGITLDSISAACMRHVVDGAGDIARRALAPERTKTAHDIDHLLTYNLPALAMKLPTASKMR